MHYLIYDNQCPFCCSIIEKVSSVIKRKDIAYTPITSKKGKHLINKHFLENINSVIYINQNNKVFIKSSAILNISKLMPFPYNLIYTLIIIPKFILNMTYDLIARNRMLFKKF